MFEEVSARDEDAYNLEKKRLGAARKRDAINEHDLEKNMVREPYASDDLLLEYYWPIITGRIFFCSDFLRAKITPNYRQ